MGPVRHLGHGRHQVGGDRDARGGNLLGRRGAFDGGDHVAGRVGEALVEHEGLLEVEVAPAVAQRRVQERHVGL
jgi:hypothetical protein